MFLVPMIVNSFLLQRYQNRTGKRIMRGNGYFVAVPATGFLIFFTIKMNGAIIEANH